MQTIITTFLPTYCNHKNISPVASNSKFYNGDYKSLKVVRETCQTISDHYIHLSALINIIQLRKLWNNFTPWSLFMDDETAGCNPLDN